MYQTILTYCFWALAIFSLERSQAQQTSPLEVCENCLDSLLAEKFSANYVHQGIEFTEAVVVKREIKIADKTNGLLYVGNANLIKLVISSETGKKVYHGGGYQAKSFLQNKYSRSLIPIQLSAGKSIINITASNLTNSPFHVDPVFLKGSTANEMSMRLLSRNEPSRVINLVVFLLLFVVLLYSLFHFIIYKNRYYKYYSFYLLSIIVFLFLFTDEYLQRHLVFPELPHLYPLFQIFFQQLTYVFYAEFCLDFLAIKKRDPFLFKVTRFSQVLMFFVGFFNPLFIFLTGDQIFLANYLHKIQFVVAAIFLFMFFRVLIKFRNPLKWFFGAGSFILFVGAFVELISVYYLGHRYPRSFYMASASGFLVFNFVEIAYLLELLIFLLGISYKTWFKEREHAAYKEKTIEQLKEKEKLEKQVNALLSDKLQASEERLELEQLNSENERNRTKLMQTQLSSLQLQMNPHYLFNSLNSINDFIISKKPQEASEYLALYARMMRNILRNSDKTFNTLEQELQFSEDYLKLESLRFENKFEFSIKRPRTLDVLERKIPGMMLQPLLENAVWHGIMPLESGGQILIDTSGSTLDITVILIKDNGVGLKKTGEDKKHKSYGLSNIHDKIELLEKLYEAKIEFTLSNIEGGSGVQAKMVFPMIDQLK